MSARPQIAAGRLARALLLILPICGTMTVLADDPGWWGSGDPPAVDSTLSATNHAPATVGQAKWLALEALRALEPIAPAIGDAIRGDLEELADFTVPDPKTDAWREKQRAALTLGQLKALALPFYNHLNAESPSWVLDQIEARQGGTATSGTHYWQVTGNAAYQSGGYFPWNPATATAVNHQAAGLGHLKSVFFLDFPDFVTAPPVKIYDPEIYMGFVYDGFSYFRTIVGQTIVAYHGEWDLSHGGKVSGYWYDLTRGIQLGDDDQLEYTVTQADVDADAYIVWIVDAVQGGHTISFTTPYGIHAVEPWPEGVPHLDNLYFNIHGNKITGSSTSGATLTKPDFRWIDPVEGFTPVMTVSGEWYKNGVATGVHASTYSDTDDGDLIKWVETATNAIGPASPPIGSADFAVSDQAAAYLAEAEDSYEDLIAGESGASDMELFTSENHSTPAYTRNTSLWAAPLVPQLTGVSAWKSHGGQSYGGVLISPRHILYCQHSHPRGYGSWKNSSPAPVTVRFVLADNTVVDATQLCQSEAAEVTWTPTERAAYAAAHPEILDVDPRTTPDLSVAVLDRDVSADGVHIVPIVGRSYAEWQLLTEGNTPYFHLSQGNTGGFPATPISSYPPYNKMMACMRAATGNVTPSVAPYDALDYSLWGGDSGTPTFILHRNTVYLHGIAVSQNYGRSSPGPNIAWINAMIAAADAGAAELGHVFPTGYTSPTVSVTDLPYD